MVKIKGDIYSVRCEGYYYALINGQKNIKPYEIVFKADENAKKKGFLSVFRNALTPKDGQDTAILRMMKQKYPDYKRFRTHQITEVINISNQSKPVKELALMNRDQITRFIDHKGYPIDADLYPSVTELRQAIRDFREDSEAFERQQAKRSASKGSDIAVQRAIEELNSAPTPTPDITQAPVVNEFDREDDELYIPEIDDEDELAALVDGI